MDGWDAVIAFFRVTGSLLRKHFSRSLLSTRSDPQTSVPKVHIECISLSQLPGVFLT